jgi:hypothetical protein
MWTSSNSRCLSADISTAARCPNLVQRCKQLPTGSEAARIRFALLE